MANARAKLFNNAVSMQPDDAVSMGYAEQSISIPDVFRNCHCMPINTTCSSGDIDPAPPAVSRMRVLWRTCASGMMLKTACVQFYTKAPLGANPEKDSNSIQPLHRHAHSSALPHGKQSGQPKMQ